MIFLLTTPESGTVSYATMVKMGVTASSRDPSLARPGLAYNQAVGARVICSLVDIGTGVEGDTDMAQEIYDINSKINEIVLNPGDLKIIIPTPIVAQEMPRPGLVIFKNMKRKKYLNYQTDF